eukprot:c40813_g1_i1 orf=3-209(-)
MRRMHDRSINKASSLYRGLSFICKRSFTSTHTSRFHRLTECTNRCHSQSSLQWLGFSTTPLNPSSYVTL